MPDRKRVVVHVVAQHVGFGKDDKTILLDQYARTVDGNAVKFEVVAACVIANVIHHAEDAAGF